MLTLHCHDASAARKEERFPAKCDGPSQAQVFRVHSEQVVPDNQHPLEELMTGRARPSSMARSTVSLVLQLGPNRLGLLEPKPPVAPLSAATQKVRFYSRSRDYRETRVSSRFRRRPETSANIVGGEQHVELGNRAPTVRPALPPGQILTAIDFG